MSENVEGLTPLPFKEYAQTVQKKLFAIGRAVPDAQYKFSDLKSQYSLWVATFADPEILTSIHLGAQPMHPELWKLTGGERHRKVVELIERLIPSPETLIPTVNDNLMYPEDRIHGILSREDSKRNIRLMSFLLNMNEWWLTITDSEFEKFIHMAENNSLPACLTSQNEVIRERNDSAVRDRTLDQRAVITLRELTFYDGKDMNTAFQELNSRYPNS